MEKHTDLAQVEYWILSEYCDNGSLSDYLKGHLVSWPEALSIAEGVSRGLAHLHEEAALSRAGGAAKPAVAHRDFKSKNVLLRRDLTPCVADFGLALIFHPHRPIGDVHPQVSPPPPHCPPLPPCPPLLSLLIPPPPQSENRPRRSCAFTIACHASITISLSISFF